VSDITAQTDQLHNSSGRYQDVSDQVAQIYKQLTARLEAEGSCWGNDESGTVFGNKYIPAALSVLSQMDNTNQGIQSMVDGICSWAKNYVDATSAAASNAKQITAPPFNAGGVSTGVHYSGG
jgi:hypothetical protein